jgi:hypothetical protein
MKSRKYTQEQKEECINYLGYCVKEGYMDEYEAKLLIENKDWKEVYNIMDRADNYADSLKE